jgi:tRNA1(Val) A37 N6-methylase TrmN6
MITWRILHELKSKDPFFNPDKILDFGAGLGSVSLAADSFYEKPKIKAVEPNVTMRKLGEFLSDKNNRIKFYENLFESSASDSNG